MDSQRNWREWQNWWVFRQEAYPRLPTRWRFMICHLQRHFSVAETLLMVKRQEPNASTPNSWRNGKEGRKKCNKLSTCAIIRFVESEFYWRPHLKYIPNGFKQQRNIIYFSPPSPGGAAGPFSSRLSPIHPAANRSSSQSSSARSITYDTSCLIYKHPAS